MKLWNAANLVKFTSKLYILKERIIKNENIPPGNGSFNLTNMHRSLQNDSIKS